MSLEEQIARVLDPNGWRSLDATLSVPCGHGHFWGALPRDVRTPAQLQEWLVQDDPTFRNSLEKARLIVPIALAAFQAQGRNAEDVA